MPSEHQRIDHMKEFFFSLGLDYYITTRCSHFAQLYPTTANQAHHAIEMLLKGFLYDHLSSEQQQSQEISRQLRIEYRHNLPMMWEAFKGAVSDPQLDDFDRAIDGLHKFEDIRYPDEVAQRGATIVGGIEQTDLVQSGDAETLYQFALAPIDRLVKVIFEKAHVNPSFFTRSLNQEAATHLTRENEISYQTRLSTDL